ncbi:hypothetical protein ACFOES_09275 [Acidimangrovimonas pyrenivorans]|uniref:Uncharacterized protein n=2 Tax=Acidimangrovimonas pyrenivorans TaxID=2030798 RepID=A0ABV7AFZ5_9RHOB
MAQPRLHERVLRSAEFRFERATVPLRNERLDAAYARAPDLWLERVDRAIDRGVAWLLPQADVSMSVLFCAKRTLERTGDSRFAFLHEKAEHYRRTIRDPALRLIYPDYDDEDPAYAGVPHVQGVRPYYPVELLMLDAAWADKRPQPDILDRLRAFADNGFYGTTHIVVGGLMLIWNGGAPAEEVREMMAETVPVIRRANEITARAEDIFAERCMVLQWLERHDLIRPSWIIRLLRNQLPDGGWKARNMPPLGQSNQHTVIVTLAALAEFLAHQRGRL